MMGKERTSVTYSAGESTATAVEEREFLYRELPVALPTDEGGRFRAGDYDIPFRFMIPEGLPGTYKGRNVEILYTITAKIDVPLGFDIGDSREFGVTSGFPVFRSEPTNACSDSWDDPKSPGINFRLDRCEYGRGEVLSGRCAFRNPGSKNLRKFDFTLKWIEAAKAGDHKARAEVAEEIIHVPLRGRLLKGESPFSIPIPQDAPLTYKSPLSSVRCVLAAKLDVALGSDVEAQKTIIIASQGYGEGAVSYPRFGEKATAKGILEKPDESDLSDRGEYLAEAGRMSATRCPSCGNSLRARDANYCTHCGTRIRGESREVTPMARGVQVNTEKSEDSEVVGMEICTVCGYGLGQRDDVVWCRHCGKLAHREHLLQWIARNRSCPACGKSLNEEDYR